MQQAAEAQLPADPAGAADSISTRCKSSSPTLRTGHGAAGTQAVITPEQRQAIDDLRRDVADTRTKLRTVQLDLRRDISRLENTLRLADIVLVPALLTIVAVVLGIARSRRRARARA